MKARISLKGLFVPLFAILGSPAIAGDPYFNLGWYLENVVVTTIIGQKAFADYRALGSSESERYFREKANPSSPWIETLPRATSVDVFDMKCEDFKVRSFSNWQVRNSEDVHRVPQWREIWHGVSARATYRAGIRGIRDIDLAVAVTSPGIPEAAFLSNRSGALAPVFFEVAATYGVAGFDHMRDAVSGLAMRLTRMEQCEGFMLYIWEFRK